MPNRLIFKDECPLWHIYPTFQAHSATQVCTGIRQNQFLLKTGHSPLRWLHKWFHLSGWDGCTSDFTWVVEMAAPSDFTWVVEMAAPSDFTWVVEMAAQVISPEWLRCLHKRFHLSGWEACTSDFTWVAEMAAPSGFTWVTEMAAPGVLALPEIFASTCFTWEFKVRQPVVGHQHASSTCFTREIKVS